MQSNRFIALMAAVAGLGVIGANAQAQTSPSTPPPFVARGMPGEGQEAMQALAGDWNVAMTLYAAMGTPENPLTAELIAHREWIADGRFLRDITTGDLPGGGKYWRMGTLGYSSMDKRFEWVTQDATNANMMIYLGKTNAGPRFPASLTGTFTDQGILGEKFAGKRIAQRSLITIRDRDHHSIEIYFTPPREKERLVDRKVYTRMK